jgi:mono/diheme cytochrome c family protein
MKFIINSVFFLFVSFLLLEQHSFAGQKPQTDTQKASTQGMNLDTGQEIFEAACVGCHGPGQGQLDSTVGLEKPATFPDFPIAMEAPGKIFDWRATIHGGAISGFSEIMPSWSEALSPEQIEKVIQYLRSQCTEPGWPLGELNFHKAIATEKAFPEDEAVITGAVNLQQPGSYTGEMVYEKRIGARGQLSYPRPTVYSEIEQWLGWRHWRFCCGIQASILYSDKTGSILSAQGSIICPPATNRKTSVPDSPPSKYLDPTARN